MATRVFLGLTALLWLPYGLFCLLHPEYLAEAAGVKAASVTGTIELRAMYGGLQSAIGALALAALVRPGLRGAALVSVFFLCTGLGLARTIGVVLDGDLSTYTMMGLGFEFASSAAAAWLLAQTSSDTRRASV